MMSRFQKEKKFSKLDSHPELRIFSGLAGVRNLLLPNIYIIKTCLPQAF